ncbi:Cancer-related nucleoside-triphosphatase homolog [Seminavis robusta]|uniref:Cancer-related nucleoside-triphosphatase homolog n=1 Tax=Seminavis robusta TaxID=568900 RepID=A0A9N8H6Z2_9STRA|nr:Cancer-related nucleoside-triphosphatase homolog [Seminavis robusta]|eukprot:Sro186_g080610.1 Cancer-related nucleoside-triphosphatase homolog (477) ;mRNA; r:23262-24692
MPLLPSKVFLTGMPGVGKTTCIQNAVAVLKGNQDDSSVHLAGFYTRECRGDNGQRIGFDIVEYSSTSTRTVPLARVGSTKPTVGKYSVLVDNVQKHMVGALQQRQREPGTTAKPTLAVLDEVGKMELLCPEFFPAVWDHLNTADDDTVVTLGTLPLPKRPIRQVERILARKDVLVLLVTQANRNQLTRDLREYVKLRLLDRPACDDANQVIIAKMMSYQFQKSNDSGNGNNSNKYAATRTLHPDNSQNSGGDRATKSVHDSTASKQQSASNKTDHHYPTAQPCGPLVSTNRQPKVLLLGDTASPMPTETPILAYSERSMWTVLAQVVHHDCHDGSSPGKYVLLRQATLAYGIAIWDVLANVHEKKNNHNNNHKSITRGQPQSRETLNDIPAFLKQYPSIETICFIGAKAHKSFQKYYRKGRSNSATTTTTKFTLSPERTLDLVILPSSSERNHMPLEEKVAQWKAVLERCGCGGIK